MKIEVKVPSVGESITEGVLGQWHKKSGDVVARDEVLFSFETDKASVDVVAEQGGRLQTLVEAGQTVAIGAVVALVDSDGASAAAIGGTIAVSNTASNTVSNAASTAAAPSPSSSAEPQTKAIHPDLKNHLSPAVQKIVTEKQLDPTKILGTGKDGRITKADALAGHLTPSPHLSEGLPRSAPKGQGATAHTGNIRRVPMTTLRKRIAERLLESQKSTATLTTFNEVDMSALINLRNANKEKFLHKYGIKLGFMGAFTKAVVEALQALPVVNASIDGNDLIYHDDIHIGVAVGTEKGLVVPVIKNAQSLTLAEIEKSIGEYATKAKERKITIEDLTGGTFTISNGGVYGSLMSTPILNPPQSGILGMHKTQDRPVVVDGQIVIRPMMYLALSYDHRVIDGKEAVTFLVAVKNRIENPKIEDFE